jgi:hypothetical protein
MARKKNPATTHRAPDPSAADAAPAPAPAPTTAPDPASPAGAAYAALAAHPGGATTAVIAGDIGIGRAAARDALTALETTGTVTRTKGGKPGVPDTWTLSGPAPDGTGPAAGPQAGQGRAAAPGGPGPQDGGDAEAGPGTAESGPGERDGDAAPGSGGSPDSGDGGAPAGEDAAADPGGEAGDAPDPALVTDLTERLAQIKAAGGAAGIALTGDTDLRAALAGLDEIAEQATAARRALKTAIGGKKAPAVRPGGLREKVLAHLKANRGKEFTPHEIHKVLGHSSGAIANALDTLVKLGDAEVATEKPRRFRLAAAEPATPAAPGADSADGGTELAGAA